MFKKNYKMTEEHKKKISDALKGKPSNSPTKFKKGHKHSADTIAKISKSRKGKSSVSGEKSNLWKGGVTPLMKYLRTCTKYRQWRCDVFNRDLFTCTQCGLKSGNGKAVILNADHIKPFYLILSELSIKDIKNAIMCEELWDINNGRTLCIDCHKKTSTWGRPKKTTWK